jgi:aspartate/methionine/tyrosine aminotransferase
LINSPSNPTGTTLSLKDEGDCRIWANDISDDDLSGLCYGETEHSILEYTDRAFVVNGFSKLLAMTGWRWLCHCSAELSGPYRRYSMIFIYQRAALHSGQG